MKTHEQAESQQLHLKALRAGKQARIKLTGQIVDVKKVSEHGIAIVRHRCGSEYFICNRFLEPLVTLH